MFIETKCKGSRMLINLDKISAIYQQEDGTTALADQTGKFVCDETFDEILVKIRMKENRPFRLFEEWMKHLTNAVR